VTGTRQTKGAAATDSSTNGSPTKPPEVQVLVFFSSLTGSTERSAAEFTRKLSMSLKSAGMNGREPLEPQLHDLSYIDYDDYFITSPSPTESHPDTKYLYLLLLPTYDIDTVLTTFTVHLQETHHDFRIDTAPLSSLIGYSVFGFGDKQGWPSEREGFASQAIEVDRWMAKLTGGKRAFPLGVGDVKSDASEKLDEWRCGIVDMLREVGTSGGLGEGVIGSGDALESDEEDMDSSEHVDTRALPKDVAMPKARRGIDKNDQVADVEDLGRLLRDGGGAAVGELYPKPGPIAIDFTTYGKTSQNATSLKEMVPKSSPTYAALTKQGYTIVGSHSGVKICRWTKSALRGRGSCYKFSFYGIKSHLCMETTPSLSCSNKCVFCWRHGTNPVGTTWRWKIDPPDKIFEGVKDGHYKKIKMMRGVPGIRADRFAEAFHIRHCALSLVGEPIFYPHINEFIALLHTEHISSFLVCNAQHPDQLAALEPVTQLYVSIDASNRESLRRIDRPLHRDFWERFQRCLEILREKRYRQRTVFRLTLVKGFNVEDEVEGYANLVEKGLPCFVEVKGVTYCGTSSSAGAGLTMQNVPFYEEVSDFVVALDKALKKRGLSYGIAAEHAHR
jgi:tRNA wybutosine-synthesizing protein 1